MRPFAHLPGCALHRRAGCWSRPAEGPLARHVSPQAVNTQRRAKYYCWCFGLTGYFNAPKATPWGRMAWASLRAGNAALAMRSQGLARNGAPSHCGPRWPSLTLLAHAICVFVPQHQPAPSTFIHHYGQRSSLALRDAGNSKSRPVMECCSQSPAKHLRSTLP